MLIVKKYNVALIGTGFMGKAHSIATAVVPILFGAPVEIERKIIVDIDEELARDAAKQYGFAEYTTDWRDVINRPDVDIVDICTPNDTHAEIAIAAALAGKHVMCEKPMAMTVADAEKMQAAAQKTGVVTMVSYNYRHTPAIQMAKKLIDEGRIGKILSFRGYYLQDWGADPSTPLSWRFNKAKAGSGTLGDIGTHVIDAARLLVGEFASVNSIVKTFIAERPLPAGRFFGPAGQASSEKGQVDVDDAALTPSAQVLARMTEHDESFVQFSLRQSRVHAETFREQPLSNEKQQAFETLARESLARQSELEQDEVGDFDLFVGAYQASILAIAN